MMLSFPDNIPAILRAVGDLQPARVLDIGSGFGKFGLLTREAILSTRAEQGNMLPDDKDLVIDCCEEAAYFHQFQTHWACYNNHFHKDVFEMHPDTLNSYDLILLIDVVEHWDKAKAIEFLKKITKAKVLISTPKETCMYEAPYYHSRKHVSQWTEEDFKGLLLPIKDYSTKDSHIFLI